MKKIGLLFISFIGVISNLYCQGTIKGILINSETKEPISNATATIFNLQDSSIANFQITGKTGQFTCKQLPLNKPLRLHISHIAFVPMRIDFSVSENELENNQDTMHLEPISKELPEIEVHGTGWEKPPISFRGDTISFNAEAFINRPGTVVEDLLKRIPGIEFSEQGILFNGKKVDRILLDGREFFGEDPDVLLKNIPSMLVDKVEVMPDKLDESGRRKKGDAVAINITLKSKAKKGTFGKTYAGGGTTERYESGGILNYFKDTLQVSFIGFSNNLSQPGFSFSDLYKLGGFNRYGVSSVSVSDNNLNLGGISFGGGEGITRSSGGGLNLSHIIKKMNVNFSYFIGENRTELTALSLQRNFFRDSIVINSNSQDRLSKGFSQNFRTRVYGEITPKTSLFYTAEGKLIDNNTNQNLLINNNIEQASSSISIDADNTFKSNGGEVNQSISLVRELSEKISLRLGGNLDLSSSNDNRINDQQMFAGSIFFPDESFNQNRKQRDLYRENGLFTSLDYEIKDNFGLGIDYSISSKNFSRKVDANQSPFQLEEFEKIESLSGDFNNTFLTHVVEINSYYESEKGLNIYADIGYSSVKTNNRLLSTNQIQNSFVAKPTFSIYLSKYAEGSNFYVHTSQNFVTPGIENLFPVLNNTNPQSFIIGNSFLEPSFRSSMYGSFYKFNSTKRKNFYISTQSSVTENPMITVFNFDEAGRINASYRNYDRSTYDLNLRSGYSFSVKISEKILLPIGPNLNGAFQRNYQEVSNTINTTNNLQLSGGIRLGATIKDRLELTNSFNITESQNSINNGETQSRNQFQNFRTDMWLKLPAKFSFEVKYNFNYQPLMESGLDNAYNLLHLSLNKQILKDGKGIIKLTVFDALNQNLALNRIVTENFESQSVSNAVVRYYMLSFVYNFNNMSISEKSRSSNSNSIMWW